METEADIFLEVLGDGVRDKGNVQECLKLATAQTEHFAPLIIRYLNAYKSKAITAGLDETYSTMSVRMIWYGLFMHSICFSSPTRSRYREILEDPFYHNWEEQSAKALSIMESYNKHNLNIPKIVFGRLYEKEVEPMVAMHRLGWWRRSRVQSAFQDRFATGLVLGMAIDTAAAQL